MTQLCQDIVSHYFTVNTFILNLRGDLEILVSLSIKKTRREYSTMKVHGRFRTNKFSWITNRKREKMNQRKILL